jgi:crotonobetainyl-CoA:carnitine CoA-transferase CaiB-like acyl-CoA transferase
VDLESIQGRVLLHRLAAVADVVLYNVRPDVPPRLGIDAETLHRVNPRLIVCSLTGFGQDGPWANRPSYDLVIQALSGAMSLTGEPGRPPLRMGIPAGDLVGGSNCVTAICAALYRREKTGVGCFLAVSLLDSLVGMLTYMAQSYVATGVVPPPAGSGHQVVFPYLCAETADRPIVMAVFVEKFWGALCRALDRTDWITDPRFATNAARIANREVIEPLLLQVLRGRTAAEWTSRFEVHGVPGAPVLDVGQVLASDQVRHQQLVVSVDDGRGGTVETLGNPFKRPADPLVDPGRAPDLDEHAAEVLAQWLDLGDAQVRAALETRGRACPP